MAVAIILLFVISLFSVGIAIIVFQPAMFTLSYETTFWKQCDTEAGVSVDERLCILRDSLYSGTIAIPIFMVAIAGVWAYLAVNRRDDA